MVCFDLFYICLGFRNINETCFCACKVSSCAITDQKNIRNYILDLGLRIINSVKAVFVD